MLQPSLTNEPTCYEYTDKVLALPLTQKIASAVSLPAVDSSCTELTLVVGFL